MDDLERRRTAWRDDCAAEEPNPPPSVLRDMPLFRTLKGIHQVFRQRMLLQMRAEGIDHLFPGTAPLLLHLGDEDDLTLTELARRCELDNSTLTPLVDDLTRMGLTLRVRDAGDRRLVRIRLSAAGRELEPRLRALLLRLQEQALANISEDEIATVRHLLGRIVQNLNAES